MTSMMDIVADATSAATKGLKRARQAAFGGVAAAAPDRAALARLIETDIIPRLLSGHDPHPRPAVAAVPPAMVPLLARALLADDIAEAMDMVSGLHAAGHAAHDLMEQLIAPAARLLGEGWLQDQHDFVDVTLGSWRCQQLVQMLAARTPGAAAPSVMQRHALILPAPGEQHVLGAMMVEDAFRRGGWATLSGPALDEDALVQLAGRLAFDVIGLSAGSDPVLAALPRTIAALRRAAGRPVFIVVGGVAVAGDPAVANRVGADAAACDAAHAVALAERHLAGQPSARAAIGVGG